MTTRSDALPDAAMGAPVVAAVTAIDWLGELAAGSESALGALIAQWGPALHRFVYRYVNDAAMADDLVQEAFVRIYQQRARYRPGRSASAWMYTIAANLCRNHRRWQGRHPTVSLHQPAGAEGSWSEPAARGGSPADLLVREETAAAVRTAIDALPHDMKTTLLLFEVDDLSYADIGGIVGCSPRGVESRLTRARARLKTTLGPLWHELTAERASEAPAERV